jgi:hypothetical protein
MGTLPNPMRCPACDTAVDAFKDLIGAGPPTPGDGTMCVYCASLLTFDDGPDGLIVRYPTDAELVRYLADPAIQIARQVVLAFIRRRAAGG